MRKILMLVVLVAAVYACLPSQTPAPATEDQKALYALGIFLYRDTYAFELSHEEFKYVQRGMADAAAGRKLLAELDTNLPKLRQMVNDRREKRKVQAREFIDKIATEKGARKTASGMVYQEMIAGTGAKPKDQERIKVQYTGKFINGKEFDSTFKRGKPAEYTLGRILPCFSEGVGMMKVGGKARFYCPPETAYGDIGNPPVIPGGALLVYDVELLETQVASAPKTD